MQQSCESFNSLRAQRIEYAVSNSLVQRAVLRGHWSAGGSPPCWRTLWCVDAVHVLGWRFGPLGGLAQGVVDAHAILWWAGELIRESTSLGVGFPDRVRQSIGSRDWIVTLATEEVERELFAYRNIEFEKRLLGARVDERDCDRLHLSRDVGVALARSWVVTSRGAIAATETREKHNSRK